MRILVMGAGALGTVAGGLMARSGHEVHLIGRAAHMNAIRDKGLFIEGIWGNYHVKSLETHTCIKELAKDDFDLVLVAVKSYDTQEAARIVAPLVSPKTWVCSYQNGLGNAELIAQEIGWGHTLGARVIFGARVKQPGRVEVTVIAAPTAIGAYKDPDAHETAKAVADAMDKAGMPTVFTDRIQTILWSKVAYNCALNPLSALLNLPYGRLAENSYTRKIMGDVVHELYQVADMMAVPLEPGTAAAYLERFYSQMLPPTAAHYASMREDLVLGRRTEIEALNGAIVRFGEQQGLVCSANAFLTAMVHARECIGVNG
jgi:2-dehydropantoate 2-reductase